MQPAWTTYSNYGNNRQLVAHIRCLKFGLETVAKAGPPLAACGPEMFFWPNIEAYGSGSGYHATICRQKKAHKRKLIVGQVTRLLSSF